MHVNRIKEHRVVKAGTLSPHPMNWRRHPARQRKVLRALLATVGFARSLTAYEDPATKQLILIDGHLRAELDPDAEVVVEILDVTPAEARLLLATFDPIAELAASAAQRREELCAALQAASAQAARILKAMQPSFELPTGDLPTVQFLVLITCTDEAAQRQLLARFLAEGLECRALLG